MARTIWSGAIGFGLVAIPIKVQSATSSRTIRFNELHGVDGERIRHPRVCAEHGEIPYNEIVKGYEIREGEYVVLTEEELAAASPASSRLIDVEAFVALADIDPIFFDKTYYVIPDAVGARAYQLLVEAMGAAGKAAIGRFVMHGKEHLVALRVRDHRIVMQTLFFADEITPPDAIEAPPAATKKEKDLAKSLIKSLARPWKPDEFEDATRKRVLKVVEAKAGGKTIKAPPDSAKAQVADLEEALARSLEAIKH